MKSKLIINQVNLNTLYSDGLSMMDIAKKFKVSVHKIVYWMDKYKIKRRSLNEALYQKHNPHGNPFSIKLPRTMSESRLFGLGLGIYWGEGNKADKYSIRVGTTDINMILSFRNFLEKFCGISKSKFKYSLMCFKNSSAKEAKKFWIDQLGLTRDKIGKVTVIKPLGKGTYRKISQYGVCTIYVFNIRLKKWLMDQLALIKYNKFLIAPT